MPPTVFGESCLAICGRWMMKVGSGPCIHMHEVFSARKSEITSGGTVSALALPRLFTAGKSNRA